VLVILNELKLEIVRHVLLLTMLVLFDFSVIHLDIYVKFAQNVYVQCVCICAGNTFE
jgi:hypothetical protein